MERFISSEFHFHNLKTLKIKRKVCGNNTCVFESYYNNGNEEGKNYLILNPDELKRFFCLIEETRYDPKPKVEVIGEYVNKVIVYEVKSSPFNARPIVDVRIWMKKTDDASRIPTKFGFRIYDEYGINDVFSMKKDALSSLEKINMAGAQIRVAYRLIKQAFLKARSDKETLTLKQFLNNFTADDLQSLVTLDCETFIGYIHPHCIYEYVTTKAINELEKYINIESQQHEQ